MLSSKLETVALARPPKREMPDQPKYSTLIVKENTVKPNAFVLALSAAVVGAAVAFSAQAETYTIDPRHTQVLFTYSHMGFSNITARFDNVEGEIVYNPEDLDASSVTVTVPIATVSSGVEAMDDHFRRDDLFDAAQFPTATFTSTSVKSAGAGKLHVTGDLTIRDVSKETTFEVTVNRIATHPMRNVPAAGFDAVATIKRSDFGVDAYLTAIPDEVQIRVSSEALAKE